MEERSASSNDRKTERLAAELRVAEYRSVRDEWMSSRDAHQHTLQWTLAAIAVLFAGILTSKIRYRQPELYVGLVGAAGLIATFSQAIWFGDENGAGSHVYQGSRGSRESADPNPGGCASLVLGDLAGLST
jgi:hypothetical protein